MATFLLISPHPDDEVIGMGGTVARLLAQGWSGVNLACSLGRPEDHERRRAELARADERLGITVDIVEPHVGIGSSDDLAAAQTRLCDAIVTRLERFAPDVIIGPTPHDLHHGHEVVGRAIRDAIETQGAGRWWQYAVWGDLPFPNLYVPLDPNDTERALYALGAYVGENERNDYRDLVSGGWIRNRALGAEKVFGFGVSRPVESRAVELAAEVVRSDGHWYTGTPRVLAADNVLADPTATVCDGWMAEASVSVHRPRP